MSYVVYICDVETTGTENEIHDIIEASFWRSSDDTQKTWFIKPLNIEAIEEKALSINGHKREEITHQVKAGRDKYMLPSDVIIEMENWILEDDMSVEDRVFIGQNASFDFNFLKKFWEKQESDDTFPFGSFVIDTILLTRLIDLATGKKRKYYNLGKLVKAFGITKGKAHRASEDVKMTKDLFYKQFMPLIDIMKENFNDCYNE